MKKVIVFVGAVTTAFLTFLLTCKICEILSTGNKPVKANKDDDDEEFRDWDLDWISFDDED